MNDPTHISAYDHKLLVNLASRYAAHNKKIFTGKGCHGAAEQKGGVAPGITIIQKD